jgi:hypothetical protein
MRGRKPVADADQRPTVTAVDIALEPDQTMVRRAYADNVMMLQSFPAGFSLDETHRAHISIFTGIVPTAALPKVHTLAAEVLASQPYASWPLTAVAYDYIPLGRLGLAGIAIDPSPELQRLRRALAEAVAPLTVRPALCASAAACDIHPALIDHIARAPTDETFSPHVTIGVSTTAFLDALVAAPFDVFSFSLASASVHQRGDSGAADRRLHALPANSA